MRIYQYASRTSLIAIGFSDYISADAPPESGKSYFVFCDPVGMPLCIEAQDGNVVWWAARVDPYGVIQVAEGSAVQYNLRWPGHYYDPETGLHYNRWRYYDPTLGRYLQSDPKGYAGSPVNLYAYASNPLVKVDLNGLVCGGDKDGGAPKGNGNEGQEGASEGNPGGAKKPTHEEQRAIAREKQQQAEKLHSELPESMQKKTVAVNGGNHLSGYDTDGKPTWPSPHSVDSVIMLPPHEERKLIRTRLG